MSGEADPAVDDAAEPKPNRPHVANAAAEQIISPLLCDVEAVQIIDPNPGNDVEAAPPATTKSSDEMPWTWHDFDDPGDDLPIMY